MDKKSKCCGGLAGVAIGDALGMPVEMMSPEKILAITGGAGVVGYLAPDHRRLDDGGAVMSAGSTTDDWQLTRVVLESLIDRGSFDIHDIALRHVAALEESVSGWGRTTRTGVEQLKRYFDSRGAEGRSPGLLGWSNPSLGSSRGCGNGVAMKVIPVGMMNTCSDDFMTYYNYIGSSSSHDSINQAGLAWSVAALGNLTHTDHAAWAAAYAVAWLARERYRNDWITENTVLCYGREFCTSSLLHELIYQVESFERIYGGYSERFSARLQRLRDLSFLFGPLEKVREVIGTGCIALESVCFAIAVFLRNPYDFRTGVLEAVNSGGDADSTASIVGGLIGGAVGVDGIPAEWISGCSAAGVAISLGETIKC